MTKITRPILKRESIKSMAIYPNDQPMEKITLGAPVNLPCKTCKKNPRRDGSSYCRDCANKYFKEILK